MNTFQNQEIQAKFCIIIDSNLYSVITGARSASATLEKFGEYC